MTTTEIREAIMTSEDTPLSDALLALCERVAQLEAEVERLKKPKPRNYATHFNDICGD